MFNIVIGLVLFYVRKQFGRQIDIWHSRAQDVINKTFKSDGRTSFTPWALSWDIIARAAHSAASLTAIT